MSERIEAGPEALSGEQAESLRGGCALQDPDGQGTCMICAGAESPGGELAAMPAERPAALRRLTERTELLLGAAAMDRLYNCRIAVAGVGGVGGHCIEALARAGVGSLHLIDHDVVTESNLNRQAVATLKNIGQKKVTAMAERLADISYCRVTTADLFITEETVSDALPGSFDYVIDAIDSLQGKIALITHCAARGIPILSCMGAGNRKEPRFTVTDLFSTSGDPLARNLRAALRKQGIDRLPVVFSSAPICRAEGQTTIGTLSPVPASAGLLAADHVILELVKGL